MEKFNVIKYIRKCKILIWESYCLIILSRQRLVCGEFLVIVFALHVDLIVNSHLVGLDILFKEKTNNILPGQLNGLTEEISLLIVYLNILLFSRKITQITIFRACGTCPIKVIYIKM